jgi:hypothetical protein
VSVIYYDFLATLAKVTDTMDIFLILYCKKNYWKFGPQRSTKICIRTGKNKEGRSKAGHKDAQRCSLE